MKKWVIIGIACCILCCMDACGCQYSKEEPTTQAHQMEEVVATVTSLPKNTEQEDVDVEEKNREMIAQALEIETEDRNIRFILAALDTVHAGKLQSAKAIEKDGEKTLEVLAEDGVSYRIYLTGSGSVEAVENLVTGEWPVQSQQ